MGESVRMSVFDLVKGWARDKSEYKVKRKGDWVEVSFWVRNEAYMDVFWDLHDNVVENFDESVLDAFVKKETPNELNILLRINSIELDGIEHVAIDILENVDGHVSTHLTW